MSSRILKNFRLLSLLARAFGSFDTIRLLEVRAFALKDDRVVVYPAPPRLETRCSPTPHECLLDEGAYAKTALFRPFLLRKDPFFSSPRFPGEAPRDRAR